MVALAVTVKQKFAMHE